MLYQLSYPGKGVYFIRNDLEIQNDPALVSRVATMYSISADPDAFVWLQSRTLLIDGFNQVGETHPHCLY